MMKIKYHISKQTDIEPGILMKRIHSLIKRPGYVVLRETSETVEFKMNIWRIASRSEAFRVVDGGRFEIISGEKERILRFSYYLSPVGAILLSAFFIIVAAFTNEYGVLYLLLFVLVMYLFNALTVKNVGEEMMKNILDVV